MAITYKDISQLTQKSTVAGTEKLPVSDTEYITPAMIRNGWLALAGGTMTGDLTLSNNLHFNAIDTRGNILALLQLNTSNRLQIGYSVATAGYDTYINGSSIIFRYGTSHTEGLTLDSSGNVVVANGLTVNGSNFRAITVSSSEPTSSQGSDGDIWIKI